MNKEEVLSELKEIKSMLLGSGFGKDELWTVEDVAKYLKYTKDYTQRHIVKSKNFPDPFELDATKGLRWKRCEVVQYAGKHRITNYS